MPLPSRGRFLCPSLQSLHGVVCIAISAQPEGGEGVFALSEFSPHTTLFSYLGRPLTKAEADKPEYHSHYLLNDDDTGLTVDAAHVMSYGRYVQDPFSKLLANSEFIPPSAQCPYF